MREIIHPSDGSTGLSRRRGAFRQEPSRGGLFSANDRGGRLGKVNERNLHGLSAEAIAGQIASAIGIIIQAQRLSDGQRKITSVSEVTGMEGRVIQMQEIFNYTRTGTGPKHEVIGEFRSTGIRPRCLHEIITRDIAVDESIFEPKTLPVGKTSDLPIAELIP